MSCSRPRRGAIAVRSAWKVVSLIELALVGQRTVAELPPPIELNGGQLKIADIESAIAAPVPTQSIDEKLAHFGAAQRLAQLGGSEPDLMPIPRRQTEPSR